MCVARNEPKRLIYAKETYQIDLMAIEIHLSC